MKQPQQVFRKKHKRKKTEEASAVREAPSLTLEQIPAHQSSQFLRQNAILHMQQQQGNNAAQKLIRQQKSHQSIQTKAVQLHPEGAEPAINSEAVSQEVQAPPQTDTKPAEVSKEAMSLSQAEKVLQSMYGGVHKIVPGSIVLLDGREAIWAKYDEVCLRIGATNDQVTPKRLWQKGDAKTYIPGLEGFADSGTVYVNKKTPLVTATAHEMLHNNTAADYRGAVGETINEGSTEYLAIKALNAAGIPTPGGATAYPTEVSIVTKLVNLVSEKTLISAYFGGSKTLIDAYNLLGGFMGFPMLKLAAETKNTAFIDVLLQPPSTAQKITVINELLDGWVSDDDINQIELVVNSAGGGEKDTIAKAIQPRIKELWSIGQRTRLRVILGTV